MAEPKYKIMGNMIWFMQSSEPPRQVTPIERELLSDLARVRGLLQRQYDLVRDETLVRNTVHDRNFATYTKQAFRLTATLRETELALAESADIGKLDSADRWTPELLLFHKLWGKAVGTSDYVKSDWQKLEHELFIKPTLAGSAETGGEKAALDYENDPAHKQCVGFADWNALLYEICKFYAKIDPEWSDASIDQMDEFDPWEALRKLQANFPRSSQNQTVSGGVEGTHEGTTADSPEKQMESLNKLHEEMLDYSPCPSREPEKLNNAQKEGENMVKEVCTYCSKEVFHNGFNYEHVGGGAFCQNSDGKPRMVEPAKRGAEPEAIALYVAEEPEKEVPVALAESSLSQEPKA